MFKLGDTVQWSSKAKGYVKQKTGDIVEVVEAGANPSHHQGLECPGSARSHASYVVRNADAKSKRKHYWPVVSKLKLVGHADEAQEA